FKKLDMREERIQRIQNYILKINGKAGSHNSIYFLLNFRKELTLRAIFWSLFIVEDCFKQDIAVESKGLSGDTLNCTILHT
ncbi:hypothetical protein M5K25_002782, partial [Dendrobium thyrsiflorum]